MNIAIINYGAGNIQSIKFAIQRLGHEAVLTDQAQAIRSADKVIFPGVGEAGSAMRKLKNTGLDTVIPTLTQPVLGICLGMQLMCTRSAESDAQGLGIFDTEVIRFSDALKVPQIGWNTLEAVKGPLFDQVADEEFIYMVHSYYAPLCECTVASCTYGVSYSAALQKDNFFGTQFHPEKSSLTGNQILKNFLAL
ncbi:imidazole glycerol phosphate synthase subunit HisH [Croceiramulus getboli]|nr:imidazole glycerol phosphate synthase subunit HisH [Flavobacteriaceae bacterium YJPT1-3]